MTPENCPPSLHQQNTTSHNRGCSCPAGYGHASPEYYAHGAIRTLPPGVCRSRPSARSFDAAYLPFTLLARSHVLLTSSKNTQPIGRRAATGAFWRAKLLVSPPPQPLKRPDLVLCSRTGLVHMSQDNFVIRQQRTSLLTKPSKEAMPVTECLL